MSIKIEHASYTYGANGPYEIHALRDINLTVNDGDFMAVIGPTGSGKSTLIQIMGGLVVPTEGSISFSYDDKRKIGMLFQYPEYQLFETTVWKDVAYGPGNLGFSEEEARKAAKKGLEMVGLDESLWEMSPFELSGGQKRRAALAGVLSMEPEILILDEPTAGLDPIGRRELFELITKLHHQEQITIVMISHSMEDVAEFANRIVVLHHGALLFDGTPSEVFVHQKELEKAHLALPEMSYLMQDLKQAGFDVDTSVTTFAQAREEILKRC